MAVTQRAGPVSLTVAAVLVELAEEYADTFALCGYDSVQLAAARTLQDMAGEEIQFACFDSRLGKAARMLGMPGST